MQIRGCLLLIILLVLIGQAACAGPFRTSRDQASALARAAERRQSDVQVEGEGVVTRTLSDDRQGSRHQRFIVRVNEGFTVLVQHNIDLAPRIDSIREGDTVRFYGEYVWNEQGGLIHWTHHDPAGRHVGGWIKHNGRTYE